MVERCPDKTEADGSIPSTLTMQDEKDKQNKIDWKPAIEIFSQVSTWVVIPIVLALIFGKMLDVHYGTRPWIFLVFTGAAFLISCFGIVRVMSKYMKEIQNKDKKENKKQP